MSITIRIFFISILLRKKLKGLEVESIKKNIKV